MIKPYWNQDSFWSDGFVGTGSGSGWYVGNTNLMPVDAFTAGYSGKYCQCYCPTNGFFQIDITFPSLPYTEKVQFIMNVASSSTAVLKAAINNGTLQNWSTMGFSSSITGAPQCVLTPATGTGTLNKLTIYCHDPNAGLSLQFYGVWVDGIQLINPGQTNPPGCTIQAIDVGAKTMMLSDVSNYPNGSTITGANFVDTNSATMYCKMNSSGTINDLTSVDPGYTTMSSNSIAQSITFPALFPTGSPPDTELPAGTSITVDVRAQNSSGFDTHSSNTVTPT